MSWLARKYDIKKLYSIYSFILLLEASRMASYEHLIVETQDRVGIITLNRPDAMNALCHQLMTEIYSVLDGFEKNDDIGCVILTGSEKAFAAGADIKEMQAKSYMDAYIHDFISGTWERAANFRKPIIAAVAGYALGGGCEVAMMCDFIIAADNAKFGQPEITLGILPGAGGTQRLTKLVGKSKAMDMCLTGRMMDAQEAERSGLVSRVVPLDQLQAEALKTATKIASMSLPATLMTKEAVNQSQETSLTQGILFERRTFQSAFAMKDQKEGMNAFIEKRKPEWKHR
jgi:enoyl-CoA hydratase